MQDFKVITIDPNTRRVSIEPPFPPQKVSGIDKLIQIVTLALYNVPGRNVFEPDQGSGLPALIGTNISANDPNEAIALVSEKIDKIREEIISNQNGLINELPSERLSDLRVLNVDSGDNAGEINISIRLVSESGSETTITL